MPRFSITTQLIRPVDLTTSRITDLLVGPDGVIYSTTRADGSITAWSVDGATLVPRDSSDLDGTLIAGYHPTLAYVTAAAGPKLLSSGGADAGWQVQDIAITGAIGPATPLDATGITPLIQPVSVTWDDGTTTIYAGQFSQTGLTAITLDGAAAVQSVTTGIGPDSVSALALAQTTNAAILYSAAPDGTLASWLISPDGGVTAGSRLIATDGLRLNTPTALETVSIAGETYVIAAGAGSDSLTVIASDQTGTLRIADHVVDDRTTRFDGVTALTSALFQDKVWIFVGGADDGISAFEMLPNGQLLHRAMIADTPDSTLANVAAIAALTATDGFTLVVASATEPGLTRLALSIDPLDAVIMDTDGSDVLTGGAGADVFVLSADGQPDRVTQFEPGTDQLDLSNWIGLRSKSQLAFETRPDGIGITYGDEQLDLDSVDGAPISSDDLPERDLIAQTRLPLVISAGVAGPLTPTPSLPDRIPFEPGTPAPPPPLDRIEDYGTGGADQISGAEGADLLFGQAGDDTLFGLAGNDLLFGGPGQDQLLGGSGDDQLFGGEGRDLGWLSFGRTEGTLHGDTLTGGDGDDRLFGQAGHDRLDGGAGNDTLVGGAGRDAFVFRSGTDEILDFNVVVDQLMLEPALTSSKLPVAELMDRYGQQDGADFVLSFVGANQLRLADVDATTLLSMDLQYLG